MSGPSDQIELAYPFATYVKKYADRMLFLVVFPILMSLPLSILLLTFMMPIIQNTLLVVVSLLFTMGAFYLKILLVRSYDEERSVANFRALSILLSLKSKEFVELVLHVFEQESGRKLLDKTRCITGHASYLWRAYKPVNASKFNLLYSMVNSANYAFLLLVGWAFLFAFTNMGGAYSVSGMFPLIVVGVIIFYLDTKVVTEFKDDLELAEITTKGRQFIGELVSESKDSVLLATVEKVSELKLPMDLKWRRVEIEIPRKDISIIKRYIFYKGKVI